MKLERRMTYCLVKFLILHGFTTILDVLFLRMAFLLRLYNVLLDHFGFLRSDFCGEEDVIIYSLVNKFSC